ncbi:DNA-binding MarR family transcriptional regulator [Thermosporothrix hazakensis]|uniref:DNA-binding MarR family transcriptional regulator n=2 Tax=Thermosporothrix TaxID=768650 RepID=A0A326U5L4_THEHA|nr:DNA-binding MarR family transcriptional regulator [Thermosporothrix hazakensis]
MSRGSQRNRREMLGALKQELRKINGFGASFFRVAATRTEMAADTDIQVLDILDLAGDVSAGQLAELLGMTTGATARILNRLEEAGLVRRERDPNDGRRVIVRLERDKDDMARLSPMFDALGKTWEELVSDYDDEQIAFLLAFLTRLNTSTGKEILRLQEAPSSEEKIFSAPLEGLSSARLVVPTSIQLVLRASEGIGELYQARFEGAVPNVVTKNGVVTLRYPRRLLGLVGEQREAAFTLNAAIPWQIVIQGGGSDITAELGNLKLASFEIKGGGSKVHLALPVPSDVVPIRISGGGSEIMLRRPAGVAVRAILKGGGSTFVLDGQSSMRNNVWLQSDGFEPTAPYYSIEVISSGSMVTITSD